MAVPTIDKRSFLLGSFTTVAAVGLTEQSSAALLSGPSGSAPTPAMDIHDSSGALALMSPPAAQTADSIAVLWSKPEGVCVEGGQRPAERRHQDRDKAKVPAVRHRKIRCDRRRQDIEHDRHPEGDRCLQPRRVVLVPAGTFLSGALFLKSDMTLHLEAGAVLLGSPETGYYPVMKYRFEGRETDCYASLINTPTRQGGRWRNIAITGAGTINANGVALRKAELAQGSGKPGRAISIRDTDGLYLYGITVRQSPAWCVHVIYCTGVSLNGVNIQSQYDETGTHYPGIVNGDSFDPDSCRDVTSSCSIAIFPAKTIASPSNPGVTRRVARSAFHPKTSGSRIVASPADSGSRSAAKCPAASATCWSRIASSKIREENAAMPIEDFALGNDDSGDQATWVLPADRTKRANALRVPLSPLARSLVVEARDHPDRPKDSKFLFTTTGDTAVSDFTKAKRRLDKAIAEARSARALHATGDASLAETMQHWTIHDLRTTFNTNACAGLIDRFGTLDPTDQSKSLRYSLSAHLEKPIGPGQAALSVYGIRSTMTLVNNFTHYLDDPINGDQEAQGERRTTFGGAATYSLHTALAGIQSETILGFQARYDDVLVTRRHTLQRTTILNYCTLAQEDGPALHYAAVDTYCNADRAHLLDVAPYLQNTLHWAAWLRTIVGLREEYYQATDRSQVTGASGRDHQWLFQPKGSIVLGPWAKSELYFSAGRGFHSDDVRGVFGTVPSQGIPLAGGATPLLARTTGYEIGLRTNIIPRLGLQLAVFQQDFGSELTYNADSGQDEAGAPSRRKGVEVSGQYHPFHWLELNADLAFSRPRYRTDNLAAYGLSLPFIADAPKFIYSAGVLVSNLGPWSGSLLWRRLGTHHLNDGEAYPTDKGYSEFNLDIGYALPHGWKVGMAIFNLFDSHDDAADYYYTSRLPGEPAAGVTDFQVHPLEPRSARFTVTKLF
jgi:outer membrane receptor protein involved in Fe transport